MDGHIRKALGGLCANDATGKPLEVGDSLFKVEKFSFVRAEDGITRKEGPGEFFLA